MPKLRIIVDPDKCIGAASCVTVSPAFFYLNDENKAVVTDPSKNEPRQGAPYKRVVEVTEAQRDELILAAESCPTLAISIWDEDTRIRLFPRD